MSAGIFHYQNNELVWGQNHHSLNLNEFCQGKETPFFIYDCEKIHTRLKAFKGFFKNGFQPQIHYAMKANSNATLLKNFKSWGCGVDVVSGGELQLALDCGFEGSDIIFSGVGKTKKEIQLAIQQNIKQINVESPQELERIAGLAQSAGKKIRVAWRLNPDVNPVTHPYITTGFKENKFGMDVEFLPQLIRLQREHKDHLELVGLTIHIGSQLLDLQALEEATRKAKKTFEDIKKQGFPLRTLDIGGGVGIHYENNTETEDYQLIKNYCETLGGIFKDFKGEVLLEPGRVLVGRAGVLITEVQYIKSTSFKNFAIVDTGMHQLLRPALYQSFHQIWPVKIGIEEKKLYDVVGPICESSDFLGKDRWLNLLQQGDLLAIADCGAYGASMASNYNQHGAPKEYVLDPKV